MVDEVEPIDAGISIVWRDAEVGIHGGDTDQHGSFIGDRQL